MGAALSLVVPLVSTVVPLVVKGAQKLFSLFKKKPDIPVPAPQAALEETGMTKAQAIERARREFGLDAVNHWNFGIIGQVKAGKSSLVNAVQGLRDTDPGDAHTLPRTCDKFTTGVFHGFTPELCDLATSSSSS